MVGSLLQRSTAAREGGAGSLESEPHQGRCCLVRMMPLPSIHLRIVRFPTMREVDPWTSRPVSRRGRTLLPPPLGRRCGLIHPIDSIPPLPGQPNRGSRTDPSLEGLLVCHLSEGGPGGEPGEMTISTLTSAMWLVSPEESYAPRASETRT